MQVRRVVTGIDATGKSVLVADGNAPHSHSFQHIAGSGLVRLWRSDPAGALKTPDGEPTVLDGPLLPPGGGTSFFILQFGPDSAALSPEFDPHAAGTEFATFLPDLGALMETDAPGMHTTATVDYALVLAGEVWLELDDGAETHLTAGDVVVQLGARHAWRNRSDQPVKIAIVMVAGSPGA